MKHFFLLLALGLSLNIFGKEVIIESADFSQAQKAVQYFKFIGESTKFGLVTTSFEGFAKKVKLSYEIQDRFINKANVSFDVTSLDSDNSSRDEKMHNKCMEATKYPSIVVTVKDSIDTSKSEQQISATMKIKDREVPVTIKLLRTAESPLQYKGTTSFNFKDANIVDPSIAIASVKDIFNIEFQIIIAP